MSTEDAQHISYRREGRIGLIELNRPDVLNAFTIEMVGELRDAARRAEADPAITAIVITGKGRAFCAGFDAAALAAITDDPALEPQIAMGEEAPALFSFLRDVSKPVIAAINGVAAAGGLVLAMMCDLRFGSQVASFTTVFARRGLIAEHAVSWLLPRLVGPSRALDLLWSSRRITAEEAFRIGLVDRIVAPDNLMGEVRAYVDELSATAAPRSIALMKQQVYADMASSFAESAVRADVMKAASFRHPDAKEGAASFLEKRPPVFAPWAGKAKAE